MMTVKFFFSAKLKLISDNWEFISANALLLLRVTGAEYMQLNLAMSYSDGQIDFFIVNSAQQIQHRPVLIFLCVAVCMAPQMPLE